MTQSIPLASDARERFLMEIAAVVPPQRLAEVHLFPPLRQGTIETGVAVIAAMPEGASLPSDELEATAEPSPDATDEGEPALEFPKAPPSPPATSSTRPATAGPARAPSAASGSPKSSPRPTCPC